MDFKKIKKYKYVNYYSLDEEERAKYQNREFSTYSEHNSWLGRREISKYVYFPYCDEIEKTKNTLYYSNVMPFGMFTPEFLLHEEETDRRSVTQILSESLNKGKTENLHILSEEQIEKLSKIFLINPNAYEPNSYHKEDDAVTFFMINEFLSQTEIDFYGDFIEQKGDEVYNENYMKFNLSPCDFTKDIFDILSFDFYMFNTNCFLINDKMPKKDMNAFKSVSRENMIKIIQQKNSAYKLRSTKAGRSVFVENLVKNLNSDSREKVTMNDLNQIATRLYISMLHKNNSGLDIRLLDRMNEIVHKLLYIATDNVSNTSKGIVPAYVVYDILKAVKENESEFSLQNYLGLIIALSSPKSVSRNGTVHDITEMLKNELEKSVEDFVNLALIFAEAALFYDDKLPTVKDWTTDLSSENKDLSIPASMLLPMIASDHKSKRKMTGELTERRNIILKV